jgi:DNA-binding NarL/FixJ family response regulator
MTTPPRRLVDILDSHLAGIREANATIQQARDMTAEAARKRRELIAELHAAGMSYHRIARETDMTQPNISQLMAR